MKKINQMILIIIILFLFGGFGLAADTPVVLPAFQIGYGNVFDIAYTPDGSKLLVGTTYGVEFLDRGLNRIRLIDLPVLVSPVPKQPAKSLALRPDGKQLAVVCNQQVYIWNEKYSNYVIVNTKKANVVSYSPNGDLLVLRLDGRIEFWKASDDLSTYENGEPNKILRRDPFPVNCVDFSPDEVLMVSGGDDQSVQLWNVISASKELKAFYRQPGSINSVEFLEDNKIVVASEQAVRVLNIKTGDVVKVLSSGPPNANFYASVDESSGKIATVDENGELNVWSSRLELLSNYQACVETNSVVFSPDGQSLMTSSKIYAIEKWSPAYDQKIATRKGVFVESVAFHPDGKTFVVGGFEAGQKHKSGLIVLYDLTNGQEVKRLEVHDYPVDVLRFSPNGTQFVSWSTQGKSMKLCNPNTWQEVNSLKSRVRGKIPFEYDLDDKDQYVISAGEEQLTLWKAEFERYSVYHYPNWPEFYRGPVFRVLSNDGKFSAFADEEVITLRFPNKEFTAKIHKNIIKHLQLSSDAKYLASISWRDYTCMLWDLEAIASQ